MNSKMQPTGFSAEVAIIGAGPAGLAVARALKAQGISYQQFERNETVGGIWNINAPGTPMYESAHFISSKTLSGFTGFPMPASFPDYPSHSQVFEYLQQFALRYQLLDAISFSTEVVAVKKLASSLWQLELPAAEIRYFRAIVVCTGAQWHPNIPELPGYCTAEVIHSINYRSASQFSGKRVLVVGAGNSGCDIAADAARHATSAYISMRRGYWFIPKHIFGQPVDVFAHNGPKLPKALEQWLFGKMLRLLYGDPRRLGLQRPDHKLFETHPLINSMLLHHLQHGDIKAKPGISAISGKQVVFTDGTSAEVDLLVLATGYQHKFPVASQYLPSVSDLYLSAFSRDHKNLFAVGVLETNSGAYQHFDNQAQLIAGYLAEQRTGSAVAKQFARRISNDFPDLTGGVHFDSSARHEGYLDADALADYCEALLTQYQWQLTGKAAQPNLR